MLVTSGSPNGRSLTVGILHPNVPGARCVWILLSLRLPLLNSPRSLAAQGILPVLVVFRARYAIDFRWR